MAEMQPNGPRRYQSIDALTAIGIGVAVNALRSIAAGQGTLLRDGEQVTGVLKEGARAVAVQVTKESFVLDGQTVLLEANRLPTERLEDVRSRIFDLAVAVANGLGHSTEEFSTRAREIEAYTDDQSQIRVVSLALSTGQLPSSAPDCRAREVVDHEDVIKRLLPLHRETIRTTNRAIQDLTDAFNAGNRDLFTKVLQTVGELHAEHVDKDRLADSLYAPYYLTETRTVQTPGDMERMVHFSLRRELASKLFSLYCQSYGDGREAEKQALQNLLVKVFIHQASEANVSDVIRNYLMLQGVAVAELTLESFKVLSVNYNRSLYRADALRTFAHTLYCVADEEASGDLSWPDAVSEARDTQLMVKSSPGVLGLKDHAFNRYLDADDLKQISYWYSRQRTLGNKYARAYRNACISAVEEIERLRPDDISLLCAFTDLRTNNDNSLMPFSEFIEVRRRQRPY